MVIAGMLSITWLHKLMVWYLPFQKSDSCPWVDVTVKLLYVFINGTEPSEGSLPVSVSSDPRLSMAIGANATSVHPLKFA
jgi:hypothetical protein